MSLRDRTCQTIARLGPPWRIVVLMVVWAAPLAGLQAGGPSDAQTVEGQRVKRSQDYGRAMQRARREGKLLLVYFYDGNGAAEASQELDRHLFGEALAAAAQDYVFAKAPLSFAADVEGQRQILVSHAAFAELGGRPGLAIIDFRDPDAAHYGFVVSIYPIANGPGLAEKQLSILLNLPAGSLTQRTLVFAVRLHADHPRSTEGEMSALLTSHAQSHSLHQASLRRQGHHHWTRRFQQINARLPQGLVAQEVCAESWPNQGILEAAIECVRSWRHSSGHWHAVKRRHTVFGYDMKRGSNGVWYATGIFGNRGA